MGAIGKIPSGNTFGNYDILDAIDKFDCLHDRFLCLSWVSHNDRDTHNYVPFQEEIDATWNILLGISHNILARKSNLNTAMLFHIIENRLISTLQSKIGSFTP
ncbi:hypothetical protein Pelo_5957 [Pelomyxa schiedti]|nr:hypothetical protein Pelo_5957 [Pelomyxa schiedti]